ncbi:cytochrome P450, partial [Peribacillus butanolivorans]
MKTIRIYAYFSFDEGPRDCIGNHFALMEAVLVLVTIAKRYKLRVASN